MTPEEALRQGNVKAALQALQNKVRDNPADPKLRTFLFQLYAVMGEWQKALTQLSVVGEMDALSLMMVQAYREAINCEALRASIFAGKHSPVVFGEPETWLAELIQVLPLLADGKTQEANALRNQAYEQAPATSGQITIGENAPVDFAWIADADSRLGPVLEAMINGRYFWIPFHRIREIDIEPPEDLRDMVWMPAHFIWANGGETMGLIPTRYPGSESSSDDQIRISRKTDWEDAGSGLYVGLGQRTLTTDVEDYALMDVRKIVLKTLEQGPDNG